MDCLDKVLTYLPFTSWIKQSSPAEKVATTSKYFSTRENQAACFQLGSASVNDVVNGASK